MALQQPMLPAVFAAAESAVADDALGGLFAVFVAAARDLLGGHAAAEAGGRGEVQEGGRGDVGGGEGGGGGEGSGVEG